MPAKEGTTVKLGRGDCQESLDNWWHEAEKLSTMLIMSVRVGEAMREGSAAPVRRFFVGLGISFGDLLGLPEHENTL